MWVVLFEAAVKLNMIHVGLLRLQSRHWALVAVEKPSQAVEAGLP